MTVEIQEDIAFLTLNGHIYSVSCTSHVKPEERRACILLETEMPCVLALKRVRTEGLTGLGLTIVLPSFSTELLLNGAFVGKYLPWTKHWALANVPCGACERCDVVR